MTQQRACYAAGAWPAAVPCCGHGQTEADSQTVRQSEGLLLTTVVFGVRKTDNLSKHSTVSVSNDYFQWILIQTPRHDSGF